MSAPFLLLFVHILHVRPDIYPTATCTPVSPSFPDSFVFSCDFVVPQVVTLYLLYFPPRFASRNSTFFLTKFPIRQPLSKLIIPHRHQEHLPTGSYLSMLSGRWVRGRRKVMKKPVRAIDMRRTATVLDFAVKQFSRASHVNWDVRPYLSSPFCVMWIDDATPENGDLVVVVVGLGGRQAVGGVCGHVHFGNGCGSIGRSSTVPLAFYRQHASHLSRFA